jgi:hypothetical protein
MDEFKFPRVQGLDYKPLEKHMAESVWQRCNCQTCQEKRFRLDCIPGPKMDFATFRNKDEKY